MDMFENLSSEGIASNPVSFKKQVEAIGRFVGANRFSRTLETGLGIGGSACYILSSSSGIHVAMDPFQKDEYNNKGLENLRKFGLLERLEFHPGFSFHVLPELIQAGRHFDFIYIDGDHRFDVALMDFFYCDLLLDIGGYVLLDDTWMHSLMAVERFIEVNRDREFRKMDPLYEAGALYRKMEHIPANSVFQYRIF